MNCRKGDLAVIVGGRHLHNIGKVVVVMRRLPNDPIDGSPVWLVDPKPKCVNGVRDSVLRPLRGSKKADETLTWAGKPQGVTA